MYKKLFLIVAIVLIVYSVVLAAIKEPVVIALNASTYTAIIVPSADCRDIVAKTSDGTAWFVSNTSAGTNAMQIYADSSFSITCLGNNSSTVFYAKASAGTPNLELIWN